MKKLKELLKRNSAFLFVVSLLLAVTLILYLTNPQSKNQANPLAQNNTQTGQNAKHQIPTPQPTLIPYPSIPTSEKIVLNGVKMDNFYYKAFSIGPIGDTLIDNSSTYKVVYYPIDKAFLISILGSPFDSVRKVAEQAFLKDLGITQADACKLSVYITTPAAYNPSEAGTNYTLSFCSK